MNFSKYTSKSNSNSNDEVLLDRNGLLEHLFWSFLKYNLVEEFIMIIHKRFTYFRYCRVHNPLGHRITGQLYSCIFPHKPNHSNHWGMDTYIFRQMNLSDILKLNIMYIALRISVLVGKAYF